MIAICRSAGARLAQHDPVNGKPARGGKPRPAAIEQALETLIDRLGLPALPALRSLFDGDTPMLLTDPNQDDDPIVFANQAFLSMTGYLPEEVLGRNCRFLQGPASEPEMVRRLGDAVSRSVAAEVELVNYRRDGTSFANRVQVSRVVDADGRIAYHLATLTDVSPLREAQRIERSLRQSERRLRAIFDSATEHAMIATDDRARIIEWNSGARALLGWSEAQALGQNVAMIYPPAARASASLATAACREGSPLQAYLRADGTEVLATRTLTPMSDGSGGHLLILQEQGEGSALDPLGPVGPKPVF